MINQIEECLKMLDGMTKNESDFIVSILEWDPEKQMAFIMAKRIVDKNSSKKEEKVAKNFIQKAIKKPGALHKELGVPMDKKIPTKKLDAAAQKGGKLGQRARLAETLKKMK